MMSKRALFLDRDGVINVDHGYVHTVEDFQFIDGIFDLCSSAIAKGYLIIVITNQAGIGRGLYSVPDFELLTDWMCDQFLREGILICRVYHSPYHPVHGLGKYKKDDFSRKPHPGMLLQAQKELDVDLGRSVFIGDKYTDMQAGIAAGVGCNVLLGSSDRKNCMELDRVMYESSLKDSKKYLYHGVDL